MNSFIIVVVFLLVFIALTLVLVQQESGRRRSGIVVDLSRLSVGHAYFPQHTDPKAYVGPSYVGWEPKRSRNMSAYLRPQDHNVLNDLSCLNVKGIKVLILVQSSPTLIDRRDANRATWMQFQDQYPSVKTLFVFGTTPEHDFGGNGGKVETTSKPLMSVQEETHLHCDVVQFDYIDTYHNITFDTIHSLKLALGLDWSGSEPDFVIIADDDTYINVPSLWQYLYDEDNGVNKESQFIVGELFESYPRVTLAPEDMNETFVDSFKIPDYLFNGTVYPNSFTGGFYILPFGTLECLFGTALVLPYFPINDAFLTGFVAEACQIRRQNEPRIVNGPHFFRWISDEDLIVHKVDPDQKKLLHQTLLLQNWNFRTKLANGYHIEQGVNGSWHKLFCHDQLQCVSADHVYLNEHGMMYKSEDQVDRISFHGHGTATPS